MRSSDSSSGPPKQVGAQWESGDRSGASLSKGAINSRKRKKESDKESVLLVAGDSGKTGASPFTKHASSSSRARVFKTQPGSGLIETPHVQRNQQSSGADDPSGNSHVRPARAEGREFRPRVRATRPVSFALSFSTKPNKTKP